MEGASHLDMAYKLVEYAGKGRLKLSSKKELYPGRKQVSRQLENGGRITGDIIGRFDERCQASRSFVPSCCTANQLRPLNLMSRGGGFSAS